MRLSLSVVLLLAASACATGPGDTPDNPVRIVRPTHQEIMKRYPRVAFDRGVKGSATVECEIIAGGLLDHCIVLSEEPAGYGFGDAAIQVAFEHHVKPDPQGRMAIGKRVAVPIKFAP